MANQPLDDADPVAQARTWLAQHGVPAAENDRPIPDDPIPDDQVSDDQVQRAQVVAAKSLVTRKLAAQNRTRHELYQSLVAKGVGAAVADDVLDNFEAAGLVDDAELARNWVRTRQQRKHLSRTVLRRELSRKGVDPHTIDVVTAEVGPDEELQAAADLVQKKMRSMTSLERDVRYRRLAGALARRGFTAQVIHQVISRATE